MARVREAETPESDYSLSFLPEITRAIQNTLPIDKMQPILLDDSLNAVRRNTGDVVPIQSR